MRHRGAEKSESAKSELMYRYLLILRKILLREIFRLESHSVPLEGDDFHAVGLGLSLLLSNPDSLEFSNLLTLYGTGPA